LGGSGSSRGGTADPDPRLANGRPAKLPKGGVCTPAACHSAQPFGPTCWSAWGGGQNIYPYPTKAMSPMSFMAQEITAAQYGREKGSAI